MPKNFKDPLITIITSIIHNLVFEFLKIIITISFRRNFRKNCPENV